LQGASDVAKSGDGCANLLAVPIIMITNDDIDCRKKQVDTASVSRITAGVIDHEFWLAPPDGLSETERLVRSRLDSPVLEDPPIAGHRVRQRQT
jgi:hypothetical protein